MKDEGEKYNEHMNTMNWAGTMDAFMNPNKMLVESATMIFIIAFMMFCMVMLIWKGPVLSAGEMMAGFFGLLLTLSIAVKQYANFRY